MREPPHGLVVIASPVVGRPYSRRCSIAFPSVVLVRVFADRRPGRWPERGQATGLQLATPSGVVVRPLRPRRHAPSDPPGDNRVLRRLQHHARRTLAPRRRRVHQHRFVVLADRRLLGALSGVGGGGQRRVLVLGACGAAGLELGRLSGAELPADVAWRWPGVYAVVEEHLAAWSRTPTPQPRFLSTRRPGRAGGPGPPPPDCLRSSPRRPSTSRGSPAPSLLRRHRPWPV